MSLAADIFPMWYCAQLLSCARLSATSWTVARQAPLSILQAKVPEWVAISYSRRSS